MQKKRIFTADDIDSNMKYSLKENIDIEGLLEPENELERRLLNMPAFRQGLLWGKPRFGHPEGKVVFHIREVLDNVNKLSITDEVRFALRIITFAHDTFKYAEHKGNPRDWSKHHSILARQFMEPIITHKPILEIIELHDEAYYSWRLEHLYDRKEEGKARLRQLFDRIDPDRQLYYLFFKCDTCTGDKNPAPIQWFEKTVEQIEVVKL